jgi:hypothetical protein
MKVLFLDIETKPNLGWFWGIRNENIGVGQIEDASELLCFVAKWYGDDETMFFHDRGDRQSMIQAAWKLLDEADVIVHFYGSQFDIKHLNREFLQNGYPPPSPFKQVDLKNIVARRFKFTSNKLQHVSTQLGLEGKVEHEGFPLWLKCMEGDDEAWVRMEEYNRQDVLLLEDVFEILIPWIPNLPSRHFFDGGDGCPSCGAGKLEECGYDYTRVSKFQRYRCDSCGSYYRDSRRIDGLGLQQSVL